MPNSAPIFTTVGTGTFHYLDYGYNMDVLIQNSGKILTLSMSDATHYASLIRYNADGSLDTTFGTNGEVHTTAYYYNKIGWKMVQDGTGSIIVCGTENGMFTLYKYTSEGSLDTTFGTDGIFITQTDFNMGYGMTLQSDGKILVTSEINNNILLQRYNANGTLDNTFGTDGQVITDAGFYEHGYDVSVLPDGSILVQSSQQIESNSSNILVRYSSTGIRDTSFGTNGIMADLGELFVWPNGKFLSIGTVDTASGIHIQLKCYNSNGTLDSNFGTDGIVETNTGSIPMVRLSTVDANGNILVVLSAHLDEPTKLLRYFSTGELDTLFGVNGICEIQDAGMILTNITTTADGKIILASDDMGNGSVNLTLINSNGTIDTAFSDGIPTFIVDGAPVIIDNNAMVSDADLTSSYDGSTLTLARNGQANSEDQFSGAGIIAGQASGEVSLTAWGNTSIVGTYTYTNGTLAITFNADSYNNSVNKVIQSIAYSNTSTTPPNSVQIDWTFNDGNTELAGGAYSATVSTTINISTSNMAPTSANKTITTNEDTAVVLTLGNFAFTDVDAGDTLATVQITTLPTAGNLKLNGAPVTLNQEIVAADIEAGNLIFTPVSNAFGVAYAKIGFKVSDGTAYSVAANTLTMNVTQVIDSISASVTTTLAPLTENLTLTGTAAIDGTGNTLNNTITGNSAANTLNGLAGNDILNGGAGADTMFGGAGNDTYYVNVSTDRIYETTTATSTTDTGGTDTVISSISYILGKYVENLQINTSSAVNGTGNTLNNTIYAGTGSNTLDGSIGTDTLSYANATSSTTAGVKVSLAVTTAQATGISGSDIVKNFENITGSKYNDTLTGNTANNTLSGGLGNDILTGGTGSDSFVFNTTLNATTNKDTITDFNVTYDTIKLENAVFAKLTTTGALATTSFVSNTTGKAVDTNDYIVYNKTTGALYYDADGSGAGASVQIALIGTKAALTAADCSVI